MKRTNRIPTWVRCPRTDDWVSFLPDTVKLRCETRPIDLFSVNTFQILSPESSALNPTLVCYESGRADIHVCWVKTPPEPTREVYALDDHGYVIAQDPIYGRISAQQIVTYGKYIESARSLPRMLREQLSAAIDEIRGSLTR